jgi:hypothetical protein
LLGEPLDDWLLRDEESSDAERRLLADESSEPERLPPLLADELPELLELLELPDDLPDEPDEPLPDDPDEPLPEELPPFLASTIGMVMSATSAAARQAVAADGVFIAPAGMQEAERTVAQAMPRCQEFLMFMEFSQVHGKYFPQTEHSRFSEARKRRRRMKA